MLIFGDFMCEVSKKKKKDDGKELEIIQLEKKVTVKSDVLVGKLSSEDVALKGLKVYCM